MEGELIIGLVAVVGLILVPSLAIAVRLSLKPTVDAVLRLREALGRTAASGFPGRDAEEIRARLTQLEAAVSELQESSSFYRELAPPERTARALPDAGAATHIPARRPPDED
jgi:hypothetical protein